MCLNAISKIVILNWCWWDEELLICGSLHTVHTPQMCWPACSDGGVVVCVIRAPFRTHLRVDSESVRSVARSHLPNRHCMANCLVDTVVKRDNVHMTIYYRLRMQMEAQLCLHLHTTPSMVGALLAAR